MTSRRPAWHRLGDTGVLIELDDLDQVLALDRQVRSSVAVGGPVWSEVVDVVPATSTLMVTTAAGSDLGRLADAVLALTAHLDPASGGSPADEIELAVTYDGPDLDEVAELTGLSRHEVIEAHTGTPWRAAFGGFAPGFVYLVGGDPRLEVPRRSEPRTAVPPGSVALAGTFSAVYPRSSPGGWQLIGQVGVAMWDVDRDPPALVRPGMRVRFVEAGSPADASPHGPATTTTPTAPDDPAPVGSPGRPRRASLTVVSPGPRALVQDQGRPALAHLGVGRSGAADRAAHALGQRLVGNDPDAAAIEVTLGGLAVTSDTDLLVAVTGAPAPAQVDGRPVGHAAVQHLQAGRTLRLGAPAYGLRSYLSVRGGIDVAPVLGSRATDTLAGLGPDPLVAGSVLPVGEPHRTLPTIDQAPQRTGRPEVTELRVAPGPRLDWLADRDALTRETWEVSPRSDRIGARLVGTPLGRHADHEGQELATEGVVRGSVQVPPGGEPVVFLADHPVTGGYPVAAVVVDADIDLAAQLRPGDKVRLRWP